MTKFYLIVLGLLCIGAYFGSLIHALLAKRRITDEGALRRLEREVGWSAIVMAVTSVAYGIVVYNGDKIIWALVFAGLFLARTVLHIFEVNSISKTRTIYLVEG